MKMKQTLAVLLCTLMMVNMFPVSVFANEGIGQVNLSYDDMVDDVDDVSGTEVAFNQQNSFEAKNITEGDNVVETELAVVNKEAYPSFRQIEKIGDITITVEAEEGVFPEDAVLSVSLADAFQESQSDTAICDLRDSDVTVAVSYTFDIKVVNPVTGEEYQPQNGQAVIVAFTMDEVAEEMLTTSVYHIEDEGTADKLSVSQMNEDTAVVETDGFSLYTVEFTYNNLEYVLYPDSPEFVYSIAEALGLSGKVTDVKVSDESLFSASAESGEWIVTAHNKDFQFQQWMEVTINDIVYRIIVYPPAYKSLLLKSNCTDIEDKLIKCYGNVNPPEFYRPGYIFIGWAESADGPVKYFDNSIIDMDLGGDKTLYAIWDYGAISDLLPYNGGYINFGGIKWEVIGKGNDKLLLFSHYILGGRKTWTEAAYYCDIVYDGFSPLEKSSVMETTKIDMAYDFYSRADISNAKLFLLSASEIITYFRTQNNRGANYESTVITAEGYWLRSPFYPTENCLGIVKNNGEFSFLDASIDYCGSRPAFVLDSSKILFLSDDSYFKSYADSSGVFGRLNDDNSTKKLTLLDESRNGFAANIGGSNSVTVVSGGIIEINYSGAKTGQNEYVSAMICDSEGTVIGYASIAPDSDGADTWSLTLPQTLTDGATYKLKVFSEQQNGSNRTDYACAPVEITLTVSGYTVNVINGTGSGVYAEGDSITIVANEHEAGKRFEEWLGADGLIFTDGSALTAKATFIMPANAIELTAYAEKIPELGDNIEKNDSNTSLGTGNISNPSGAGQWNYVYYGKYRNAPVKYRVLDKNSEDYNGNNYQGRKTILLDCDSKLFEAPFYDDRYTSAHWEVCSLRSAINGAAFYSKRGVFTSVEKAAIVKSEKEGDYINVGYAAYSCQDIDGDRIFLLDYKEATSSQYGYGESEARRKSGEGNNWWLKSMDGNVSWRIANIDSDGQFSFGSPKETAGVSPVFNVDLASVLFASEITYEPGSYKLTLKDDNLSIETNGTITRNGNTLTVPHRVTGSSNRVSVLITNKDWTYADAEMKYYGELDEADQFTLPDNFDNSWKTYILAEQVNSGKQTDYASVPVEITIPPRAANITVTPSTLSVSIDKDGWMPFTVNCTDLDLGSVASDNASVRFCFNSGTLVQQNTDKRIDYEIYLSDHTGNGKRLDWEITANGSTELAIKIDPDAFRTAEPGVYSGFLNYSFYWYWIGDNTPHPEGGSIALTFEVTKEPTYILKVSNGTGSGKYSAGQIVTVTADEPERGKEFWGWRNSKNLTFTSGGEHTPTASFLMPAKDWNISARYKDAYVTAYDRTFTYTKDTTYNVEELFDFTNGAGTPSYSIISGVDAGTGEGTLSGNHLTITKAGTIKVHAVTAETGNVPSDEATAVLTVAKAMGTATISVADVVYGSSVTPVIGCSTDSTTYTVTYTKAGGASSTVVPSEAGNYTATVRYEATDLYEAATASTTFTIRSDNAQDVSPDVTSNSELSTTGSGTTVAPTHGIPTHNTDQNINRNNDNTNNERINPLLDIDESKSFIKAQKDQVEWDEIKEKLQDAIENMISNAGTENLVTVNMNGSSVVPGDVLDYIKGQNVTVEFDLGYGIKWTICGMDITGDDIGDIDFFVSKGTNTIPVEVINNVTGERYCLQISLAHEGDFGFIATLSIDMDKKNAGLFANLFYYNKDTEKLEFICADEVSEEGIADLAFTHASDYTIILDTEPMGGILTQSEIPVNVTGVDSIATDQDIQNRVVDSIVKNQVGDKNVWNPRGIALISTVLLVIGFGGVYMIRKKKQ